MNQILAIGNKNGKNNNNSTVDLKKIILFFSIAIIIFGVVLVINGVFGLNKGKTEDKAQEPSTFATLSPRESPTPIIDEDTEPPKIELSLSGEVIRVVVTDDTELYSVEVIKNDEVIETINPDTNKKQIETTVEIQSGRNVIKIVAEDKAGNVQEKMQEIHGKVRPVIKLERVADGQQGVLIEVTCEDGISKINYKINDGKWTVIEFSEDDNYTKEDWASVGVILEYSNDGKIIKVQRMENNLVDGENIFTVYAYSLEGLVGDTTQRTTK